MSETTKLSDLRVQEGTGGPFGVHSHLPGYRPAEVSDLVEALDGEVLKDATIRDKRGNYRNGDFLVVRLAHVRRKRPIHG